MNKHIHRIIFNKTRGQFVAVSETALSQGKGSQGARDGGGAGGGAAGLLSRLAAVALACCALFSGAMDAALAAPVGGVVAGGSASITQGTNLTTIQQNSNRAIINWQSFGIGNGQTVQVNQPGVNAALLNRVTGNLPTQINGNLLANGQVFLVNPNGIVVGANGVVNVNGGFVASTQTLGNDAFMGGGALNFSGGQDGNIQVLGRIDSANGPITLIAPKVDVAAGSVMNAGAAINLIAASTVSLSNGKFTVTPQAGDAGQITMAGALQAAEVQLAAVNHNLGALAINTSGTLRATGVQSQPDGSIKIVATGQGRVELTDAKVTATNADGSGGKIDITGHHTGLFGSTTLDASGTTQGGNIRVGGGYQGKESDIANGQATFVGADVQLKADATIQGDGGRVVVWADGSTRYNGALSAKGAGTGNGGNAEVSGKGTLAFNGTVDLRGGAQTSGANGTLLLDPSDITISNAADDSATIAAGSPGVYNPTLATSNLNITTLKAALESADVTVKTSGGSTGAGNITIVHAIDFANSSRNSTLRLEADRDIAVNGELTDTGTANTSLSLHAAQDISINAPITVKGSVFAHAGRDININNPVQSTGNGYMMFDAATLDPLTEFDQNLRTNWKSGTGVVRFAVTGSVGTGFETYLQSGKDATGARTNYTASTNGSLAPKSMFINGFDTVTLDVDRNGNRTTVEARTINVAANTLGDNLTQLHAAGYDTSNNYVDAYGWQNRYGQINFTNQNVVFAGTGLLELWSGLAAAGPSINNRNDLPGTVQLVSGSGTRDSLSVTGFRDVILSQAITASDTGGTGIDITGRNIQVDHSLTSQGVQLSLVAAAYDTGAALPNSYASNGWFNQPGLLRFSNPATTALTGGANLFMRSGADYANNPFSANPGGPGAATSAGIGGRVDLPSNLTFAPRAIDAMPNDVYLTGFRDVTVPFSAYASGLTVYAQNITVPASYTGIFANGSLQLTAAVFADQTGSPAFPGAPALVSAYATSVDNQGTVNRPGGASLDLGGHSVSVRSGIGAGGSRTSLNLGDVTSYLGDAGGPLQLFGFDTVATKAGSPIVRMANDGYVSIYSAAVVVQSNITSPVIGLYAGLANSATGIYDANFDANSGTLTFTNNPVLRAGFNPDFQTYGGISLFTGGASTALSSSGASGVTFGYPNPAAAKYTNFQIYGFNGTEVLMENAAGVAQILKAELPADSGGGSITFNISQHPGATHDVVLLSDVSTTGNTLAGYSDGGIDAGGGGIRTGNHTITSPNAFYLYAGKDSAVNMAGNQVRVLSRGAGTTVVVNEKDNVSVYDADPTGAGNIEINARGEIDLPTNWARTNGASLTFRADARYGRTLAPGATAFVTTDLNTIYTSGDVFGDISGDGLGAVTLRSAGPILLTPVFHRVVVVEADTTAPADLFDLSGNAIAVGTALTRGQQYSTANVLLNFDFDTVTANGNPIRLAATVQIGGFIVPDYSGLQYYDSNNQPLAGGSFLPTGTAVLLKPGVTLSSQLHGGSLWTGSGAQAYVVGGYQTAAGGSTPLYTSLGMGVTTTHATIGGTYTAGTLAGDTPVNAATPANYYGNPVTGDNSTLNLSGQFYSLNGVQVEPNKLNQLAAGAVNKSTSGNGWDIGFGTGTLSTNDGDLRIYSGPAHATNGPGYVQGGAADLNIFTNPPASQFGYTDTVRDGAIGVSTGTGNLVVLGYRDVNVEANGTLASSGNVTIGAARDLTINAASPFADNAGKLTTLIAGNMITATQPIGSTGTGNMMLVAGGGVNVATNVDVLSGSLQDSTPRTGVLAGGLTPTGTFNVTNTGALTLGGPHTNNEVTDVTFDGTTGIVYAASTPLARSGVVSASVNGTAGFGAINIAATGATGSITVAQDVRASQEGSFVSLRADSDIAQTNSAARVAADSIHLRASAGSIGNGGAAVAVSKATPASATAPQVNFTQTGAAGSGVTIRGDTETHFSGTTTAGDAGIALSTVNGSLRVRDNSGALGAGFNGIRANGAGAIALTAGGAASDVISAATTRSGTGTITATGRNIVDSMAGELGSGTDTTTSTALNFVTGGNITFNATDSVGGDGTTAPNALEVAYGGNLTSTSAGIGAASGTYLTILDSSGGFGLPQPTLAVTSAKNVDITSRASTTPDTGDLTLGGVGITSGNAGYIRVAADRNVTLSGTIDADTSGNVVIAAGLNPATGGSITQSAAGTITSGSGEVNLHAANDIVQGANITTAGNVLAQAVAGAIASTGGVWTSTGAVGVASLQAAATIGTAANRITTNAANTVLQSAGNQFLTSSGATTLAAATTANGAIDVRTTTGSLTVGDVAVGSALTPTTGGLTTAASGAPTGLQGVAANDSGAITLAANGAASDLTLNRNTTSGSGAIALTASQNVRFAQNNAQAFTSSTVTVQAGNDIVNATGQTSGVGSVDQIVAAAAVLRAGRHIGSGVIDNTLTSVNNASDLNLNVARLTANAGLTSPSGDAVLWNRGATDLVGANSAKGYFGINAGGLVQQVAGATLTAANAEFETMRNTTIGRATLANTGDLNLGKAGSSNSDSVVGGNLSATSTAGTARVNAAYSVNVNGDARFTGATGVQILGSVRQGGNLVQNGAVTNTAGEAVAEVLITGTHAVVTASGNSALYLLTSAVVAQLSGAGVTSVTIDLGNTVTTYPVGTSLVGDAILLGGANNVSGNWTVRTGSTANATPTTTTRQYNLTDGASPLNLGAMDLTVNAARGTRFAAGSQASTVLAQANAGNTAAGFNTANGSSVSLTGLQTSGVQSVKDAYDVVLNSPGTINAGYVYVNRDMTLVAGSAAGKNLNTSGALRAGRDLIGVAGMDVNLNAGTRIAAANGRVTVADETAGTGAGAGRFTNRVAGLNIVAGAGNDVAIYGVAGGAAPAGYESVATQVLFNGLQANGVAFSEMQLVPNWGNAYQRNSGGSTAWGGFAADGSVYLAGAGKFGSPEVWYKTLAVAVAVPLVPATPVAPMAVAVPAHADGCLTQSGPTGRYLPHQYGDLNYFANTSYLYGDLNYFANTSYLPASAAEGRDIQEELRRGECNWRAPYLPAVYRPEARRTPSTVPAPTLRPVVAPQAAVTPPSAPARQPHRVTISADGLFAFDKSGVKDMLPEGRAQVEGLARHTNKSFADVTQVLVVGHTDRLGGSDYNLELSRKRAETVRALLVSNGMDSGLISTAGRGSTEPLVECRAEGSPQALKDCLQPNRRVTVDTVGEAKD